MNTSASASSEYWESIFSLLGDEYLEEPSYLHLSMPSVCLLPSRGFYQSIAGSDPVLGVQYGDRDLVRNRGYILSANHRANGAITSIGISS